MKFEMTRFCLLVVAILSFTVVECMNMPVNSYFTQRLCNQRNICRSPCLQRIERMRTHLRNKIHNLSSDTIEDWCADGGLPDHVKPYLDIDENGYVDDNEHIAFRRT